MRKKSIGLVLVVVAAIILFFKYFWYALGIIFFALAQSSYINFYGRALDQNNLPLANAVIEYSVGSFMAVIPTFSGQVITDSEGVFNIHSLGYWLEMSVPKHDEISDAYLPAVNIKSDRRKSLHIIATDRGGWKNYTKTNPYVFNVWRTNQLEKVKHNVGEYGLYGLRPDGSTYTLTDSNYVKGRRRREITLVDGETEKGFVNFTCDRFGENTARGWKVTVHPISGGIQPTNDFYQNIAPINGYEPFIEVSSDSEGVDEKAVLRKKKYYFVAHNKSVYGSLNITYMPYAKKNACHLVIGYKINDNASRNLAVKKEL